MQIKRIALGGIIMTVIMFTPTYACVGTSDGIASYRSMENYISQIEQNGTNAKIEVFKVSAKYCYVTRKLRLHQNDRCKRFTLF